MPTSRASNTPMWSSSDPVSADRWRRTGWRPMAGPSWCWSAAGPTPGVLPAHACGDGPELLGPPRDSTGCSTSGRSAASRPWSPAAWAAAPIYANVLLRKDEKWFVQEHAAPGRRLRALAGHPRRPRTALRRRRADARARRAIPDPVRRPRPRRCGTPPRRPRPESDAAARGQLRARRAGRAAGRRPSCRRRRTATSTASAADLPAVRRVRPRLQRRCEEHPGPHLPLGGQAPRCGPAHRHEVGASGPARAAATRYATSCTRAGR